MGKLLYFFNNKFRYGKNKQSDITSTYNPKSPYSFVRWAKSIIRGKQTAFIKLNNPLLVEFITIFKEFGWTEQDVRRLHYINYLEYLHFTICKNIVESESGNK